MEPLIVEGIVLYSKDLGRAKEFYHGVLGLPVLLEESNVIHFDAGSVRLAIHRYPLEGPREAPEGFVVFAVENLATAYEDLRRKGAEFLGPPANRPYGRVAYLHDPEGHEIGLLEEPAEGTKGRGPVAPLVERYERLIAKLRP